ncbi:hypothetical protein TNCV_2486311 [Trichonephila clavipes]|uniref:RNA-directed DNA polymerase n=1 Tax=Trichonephila clavipes TaxID=2585209 RepID=A0A8X6W0B5_TRICX|nr:hypothetical protein TNCV_2486311 [Trichonephila clavipes]
MKPSQLLRKMKSLAVWGVNISEKVLRTLRLDKLPDSIKNILVISSENLENLSVMADKIFEINSSPEIYSATADNSAMKNILDKVSILEQRISELSSNRRNSRSEFKNSNQTRKKSRNRSRIEKLRRAVDLAASSPVTEYKDCRNYRLFVTHKNTGLRFLVDSGADLSIISASWLRREFQFPFIIAKVDKGIIGADFLNKFNLLIDIRNKQLIDGITNLHVKDNDIIRPSKYPWTSPLHLGNKKDGSVRPCGNYRRLNAQTIPDHYPIPLIEDFHHILKGNRIFSKTDLFKAYFQIPIAEEDKEKTAIITPFGLFEFNNLFLPYLDDILVASENEEQHKTHLKLVFDRLQKYGLRVNISKSTLGVTHLEFLGYLITPEGSKPLSEKVDAILSYKLPETIRDLRTFLGLLNFHRRYLKNAPKHQAILHEYLKGSKKNDKTKIVWTEEAKENFEKCEPDLVHATLLCFPDPNLQLALFTDASNFAIGSVLQQFEAGNKIADAQVDNEELNKLRLKPSLNFKQYRLDSGKLLWCDISTANIRPFTPQPLRMHMFKKIHNLAHPGVKSTVKQMASRFIWLNIGKDVNQWVKSCIQCQKNKINRHTHSQIGTFQEVDDRFSVIHVDIIGRFPVSEGK